MARVVARRIANFFYDVIVESVVWLLLMPAAAVQLATGRVNLREIGERLGRFVVEDRLAPRRVVIHAVSVGEVAAAGAFILALRRSRPEWSIVLTCGNRAGRTAAVDLQRRISAIEQVLFLPWDRRSAMDGFLRRIAADAVVVVEPEIWPNLYRACERSGVPLLLVNAHMYPRDTQRYRMVRWFLSDVLRAPVWIAAQTDRDRDALIAIGAPPDKTVVAGSFKFDVAGGAVAVDLTVQGRAPLVVAGSTHHPEEMWLLRACLELRRAFPEVRLVIAPRDVRRAASVAVEATARGFSTALASGDRHGGRWDVMIVDSYGLLPALYAAADVAFVGGSLVPRGGHNVLEPAAQGRPVIVGPYVDHVRDIVEGLETAGGVIRLAEATPAALAQAVGCLIGDVERRHGIGARARAYQRRHTGAADRCAAALVGVLDGGRSATPTKPLRSR